MYKKMLVPLDASEYAECTLSHVKEVASAHKVDEVVLLTVLEPPRSSVVSYLGADKVGEFEQKAGESARKYLQKTKEQLALGCDARTVVVSGQPADAILNYIDDNGVDLVIMSTHGMSGPSKWFVGSVAEKVIQRSPVPVFLVPSLACRLSA